MRRRLNHICPRPAYANRAPCWRLVGGVPRRFPPQRVPQRVWVRCSPHMNQREHAAAHLASNRARMARKRCMACWVTRAHCMCERLRELRIATDRVNVLVAMHYKEYGKATNTAKLLPHLIGPSTDACSLCVYPVDSLQERLQDAGPALLLWPGEDSTPAAELRGWVAEQRQRVTLLVIDGTWGHARAMARCVPESVRRVHVSAEVAGPSLFRYNRRQATPVRVSTLEAVGLALRALGEAADTGRLVRALRLQAGAPHAPWSSTAASATAAAASTPPVCYTSTRAGGRGALAPR